MIEIVLLLAMVGSHQNRVTITPYRQDTCYRNWCDEMMPRLPSEIVYLPYAPVMRPLPEIAISVDLPHEFGATADCPEGWTVDQTDLLDQNIWKSKDMKYALNHLVCRKKTFADQTEEEWRHCRGWGKPNHQVTMHYSGRGWEGSN